MMKKNFILMVSAVIFLAGITANASAQINLSLDVGQFRFNADSSLVEVYYGLNCEKQRSAEGGKNPFVLALTIATGGEQIVNNIWKVEIEPNGVSENANHSMMIDVMRYLLPAGSYNFKLVAKDLADPNFIDSVAVNDFVVQTFLTEDLSMSSLELAQEITPVTSGEKDRFYKNRFRVVPNPLTLYGESNNQVYYYFESYNLPARFSTNFYSIKRSVTDSYGLPLPMLPVELKKKRIRGKDAAEVGMFDVSKVPSGTYFLQFALVDEEKNIVNTIQKRFFVHNPNVAPINRDALPIQSQVASSEIALLSSKDVDILTSVIHDYLADASVKNLIDELNTEFAKREFLYRYWKNRDDKKETEIFESLREIMNRIRFANETYDETKLAGWRSDRGRVLITYGKPSEIQRYPNVSDFKEFEAWSYDNIERGVVFIFAVKGAFGDLSLIHSTKTGELRNDFWFDLIKVTSGQTGLSNEAQGIDRMEIMRETFRSYGLELPRYLR